MNLAKRSIFSISWNFAANIVVNGMVFGRAIVLARLLPVEVFGIYAGYHAILDVTVTATDFGLANAYVHRAPETENEDQAAAMHFTLRLVLLAAWTLLAVILTLVFMESRQQPPFLWMIASVGIYHLTGPAQAVLVRRVDHRRAAWVNFSTTLLNVLIAVTGAWMGWGIYAIILSEFSAVLAAFVGYYFICPQWRIKLTWRQDILRYYLDFGRRAFAASFLYNLLDRVDDLWTRFRLGEIPMGFYSRAYRFAIYPRLILATPVTQVIGGTYAALKNDRRGLSQAFFRANALLIRSGFLMAGWMALIAPEFIRILLTDKWLPMLDAFRLMLVFTMLDPLKLSISEVLSAVGKPEKVVFTRLIQLATLFAGLALFAPLWGIAGVALAVDLMLLLGIGILLWQAKEFVDYSLPGLFFAPIVSLALGILLTWAIMALPGMPSQDWPVGGVKTVAFGLIYLLTLFLFERQKALEIFRDLVRLFRPA